MFGRRALVITALLALAVAIVFGLFPSLDLTVSRLFTHVEEPFSLRFDRDAQGLREVGLLLPTAVIVTFVIALILPALQRGARGFADARSLIAVLLTFALGPGLLVNVGLKSHWDRPRPVQVEEFGGRFDFMPWWDPRGACIQNCSFVSGETASATAMVAAAAVLPAAIGGVTMVMAVVFAAGIALLRVAFGGHFLSDVLFAVFFTHLIAVALFRFTHDPRWPFGRQGAIEAWIERGGEEIRRRVTFAFASVLRARFRRL